MAGASFLGLRAPLPPRRLARTVSPSLLVVTAEWDRRSRPSLTWPFRWSGTPGVLQLPLARKETCSFEPQPLATLLLFSQCWDPVSPLQPLSVHRKEGSATLPVSAHILPFPALAFSQKLPTLSSSWTPKPCL